MSIRLTALLLFAAMPAAAQTGAAVKATPAKGAADKQICRRDLPTGSIMPGKRVCHTAAEWKQVDDSNASAVDNFRSRPSERPGANFN